MRGRSIMDWRFASSVPLFQAFFSHHLHFQISFCFPLYVVLCIILYPPGLFCQVCSIIFYLTTLAPVLSALMYVSLFRRCVPPNPTLSLILICLQFLAMPNCLCKHPGKKAFVCYETGQSALFHIASASVRMPSLPLHSHPGSILHSPHPPQPPHQLNNNRVPALVTDSLPNCIHSFMTI